MASKVSKIFSWGKILDRLWVFFTEIVILALVWVFFYGAVGEEATPSNGKVYSLLLLFVAANVGQQVVDLIGFPKLLGMLISGFILSNCTALTFDPFLSSLLRNIALALILLRAGLGLDPNVICKMSRICLQMAFIPLFGETIAFGVTGYFILGLPLEWSFMLGFIVSAASAAVVVPGMITLQENRLGTNKGIPSIVIAASSVDDVVAITGFGVMLGLVFTSKDASLVWQILKGPVEALTGLAIGVIFGLFLWYFPDLHSLKMVNHRFLLIIFGGLAAIFVSNALDFSGSGALAALTLAFVAGLKLRKRQLDPPIESGLKTLWDLSEPFLFSLIGAEVKLSDVDSSSLEASFLCLGIGLLVRVASTFLALWGAGLNAREKLFMAIAWMSKATVQAAVGPIALDLARKSGDQEAITRGTLVLTIAVLSILVSTPIGVMGISFTAKRFLASEIDSDQSGDNGDDREDVNPIRPQLVGVLKP